MDRKVIDRTKEVTNNNVIYIFNRKYDYGRIMICAKTERDVLDLLKTLNQYYEYEYDIDNYTIDYCDDRIFKICDIDENYKDIPFFVSEKQYREIKTQINKKIDDEPKIDKGKYQIKIENKIPVKKKEIDHSTVNEEFSILKVLKKNLMNEDL